MARDLKVLFMSGHEYRHRHGKQDVMSADIAIVDGVVIKNREGKHGGKIGRAILTWEEEISESFG